MPEYSKIFFKNIIAIGNGMMSKLKPAFESYLTVNLFGLKFRSGTIILVDLVEFWSI